MPRLYCVFFSLKGVKTAIIVMTVRLFNMVRVSLSKIFFSNSTQIKMFYLHQKDSFLYVTISKAAKSITKATKRLP